MSPQITSPAAGLTARSTFGPTTVDFVDGVATVPAIGDGLRAYLAAAGYTITEDEDAGVKLGTIDEVLAMAAGMSAEQIRDLAEAEQAGKARATLLKKLDDMQNEVATTDAEKAADADAEAAEGETEGGEQA